MSLYTISHASRHVLEWESWMPYGWMIPFSWAKHLKRGGRERNPTHWPALVVLAEICFWHKPVPTFDDRGQPDGLMKRFMGDDWRVNYEALSEKLEINISVLKRAVAFLEEEKLIKREIHTQKNVSGGFTRYVTIRPLFSAVQAITSFEDAGTKPSKVGPQKALEGTPENLTRHVCKPSKVHVQKVRTEATSRKEDSLTRPGNQGRVVDSANAPSAGLPAESDDFFALPDHMRQSNMPTPEEIVVTEAEKLPLHRMENGPEAAMTDIRALAMPIKARIETQMYEAGAEDGHTKRAILAFAWKYFTGDTPNERDVNLSFRCGQSLQELLVLLTQVCYLRTDQSLRSYKAPEARKCYYLGQLIRNFPKLKREAERCFPEEVRATHNAAFHAP